MNKTSLKTLLKNRDFMLLLTGKIISWTGSLMQTVAVNWQLYQLTKSPLSLGILGLASFLPIILFSFFSGITSDIFNRKKIIFFVETLAILNALVLAYLTIYHLITPLLIYILVGIDAGFYCFELPDRQSILPNVVEKKDFPLAVNMHNIFFQSTSFIGPAIAGFVIAFAGVKTVYFINAASFLAVLVSVVLMSPLPKRVTVPKFSLHEIFEGLKYVFRTPIIASSMFIDFFATFFASAMTLMPIFATSILKVGPIAMGFLYSAPSIGAILAGFVFPIINHVKEKGKVLVLSILFYGLNVILFAISKNYYLSILFIGLSGAGDMISATIRNTIRQLITPDHLRGRMSSINMVFFSGGPQLGETEAGIAAHFMGTPLSVAFGGLATIIATFIIAVKTPELLNYRDEG